MKIVFTGGSSFTGYWFARSLAEAGHEVVCPLQHRVDDYEGVRRDRIEGLTDLCELLTECSLGTSKMVDRLHAEAEWDVFCHHAAYTRNYKSSDFDYVDATLNNTHNISAVFSKLAERGCQGILATGTVFEPDEGTGNFPLHAFSPYGLSKRLSWQIIRFEAMMHSLGIGKFVIPNPFGPLEDFRFTSYLAKTWLAGDCPCVRTPAYIRDNVPITLLASAYVHAVEQSGSGNFSQYNPSFYVESQGIFAKRLASRMRPRLKKPCELDFQEQTAFSEPKIRFNTATLNPAWYNWQEDDFYDALAAYYLEQFGE